MSRNVSQPSARTAKRLSVGLLCSLICLAGCAAPPGQTRMSQSEPKVTTPGIIAGPATGDGSSEPRPSQTGSVDGRELARKIDEAMASLSTYKQVIEKQLENQSGEYASKTDVTIDQSDPKNVKIKSVSRDAGLESESIMIGDTGYLKDSSGAWHKQDVPAAPEVKEPGAKFGSLLLQATSVEPAGSETINGIGTKKYALKMADGTAEIYVDSQNRLVRSVVTISADGGMSDNRMTYGDFNAPVTIEAPKV